MSATRAQIRQSIARSARLTALIADAHGRGTPLTGGFAGATLQKPGKEPSWNLVLPKGKWHGPNFERLGGSIDVTDEMVREIVANWEAAGKPRLPIRWGHEHLSNTDPAKQAFLDRKAGNLVELRAGAHGVEALTAWNELGAKDVEQGAFDAWSPEWYPSHTSRKSGETKGWWLSGVALTGDPYFHTMPPVAASTQTTDPTPQHRSNTMNEEQLKLRASLGLAPTATDAEVLTAQTKQATELAALKASAEKSGPSAILAVVEPVQKQVEALTAALAKREAEAAALTAAMLDRDVDALISRMKSGDGKSGRAIVAATLKPVVLALVASAKTPTEGLKVAEDFITANIALTVPVQAISQPGTTDGPLTAAAANAKIAARADELRKAGDPTPTISAMREMPNETLIAENRRPTSQN